MTGPPTPPTPPTPTPLTAPVPRAPADWIRAVAHVAPARVPVGHTIRAGVSVGLPFVLGALLGHTLTGMWVGVATLLLAAGEREGTYRLNFLIIAVSTPIAAAGYLLGFAQNLPLPALMVLAAVVAFIAGAIAGLGPAFSVGGMQFLLVAAIAMGVPHVNWWTAIGLYVVGALFYAALLAAEMLINPRRPQRIVTVSLLQALADLAAARTSDLADGGDRTTEARRRATGAYQAAVGRAAELTARPSWSTRVWVLDGQALTAADRTQAFLVAETDPVAASVAADHLAALAAEVEATGLRCRGKDRGKNGDNATPHGSTSAPGVTSRADQKYVTTTTPPSTPGPYADWMLGRSVDQLALALNRPADPRSVSRSGPHVSPTRAESARPTTGLPTAERRVPSEPTSRC